MVNAAQALDRFRLALNVAAIATLIYLVIGLFTNALGGFVLPALAGGLALAFVLVRWNRRHPARADMTDPFARDAFSSDPINFAHVRVAGVGGAGLLLVVALVALEYDLTAFAVAAGLVGGLIGGTALVVYRRRR